MPDRGRDLSAVTAGLRDHAKRHATPPYRFQFAIVGAIGGTAPTGESTVDVYVGDPPNRITYPMLRFVETPTALVPGDKVLIAWIGGDPIVAGRLVP